MPYPEPADELATRIGRANRRKNTQPEVRLRSTLQRRGLRFRKHYLLRCGGVRVRPDIVFTRVKLAVFVDGCFWHGCPEHQRVPMRNPEYWVPKLRSNIDRDGRVDAALTLDGWRVLRVWEHVDIGGAADLVEEGVRCRRVELRLRSMNDS